MPFQHYDQSGTRNRCLKRFCQLYYAGYKPATKDEAIGFNISGVNIIKNVSSNPAARCASGGSYPGAFGPETQGATRDHLPEFRVCSKALTRRWKLPLRFRDSILCCLAKSGFVGKSQSCSSDFLSL